MKLHRNTGILLAIALILGGTVFALERQTPSPQAEQPSKTEKILTLDREKIQKITIQTPQQTLSFAHTDNPYSPWQMTQPQQKTANTAVISYLIDQLATAKSDRNFTITPDQKAEFGLEKPSATISVQLQDQSIQKLILGKPDFKNEFIYAEANPSRSNPITVELVSQDLQFAIDRNLSEWLETADPAATSPQNPTATNSPAPSPALTKDAPTKATQ